MGSVLRSLYAWLLLSALMLPLFPVATVYRRLSARSDPRRDRLRVFAAAWISLYGRLTPLYDFRIDGRERLPRDGPYVLVANHESGLDALILLMLKTPARFLAEDWMFRIPLASGLFEACQHIPLRVGDRESGRRALATAGEALFAGTPVAMFPEGQLNPAGLGEFRPGAFVLAHRAGVPIVPVRIEGAARAWQPGSFVVRGRHAIRIAVLEPVPARDVADTEPDALRARVRDGLAMPKPAAARP